MSRRHICGTVNGRSPTARLAAAATAVAASLGVAGVAPAALVNEGPVEVDLRASDLQPGTPAAWNNAGAAGGTFNPVGAPTVGPATDKNSRTYQAAIFSGQSQAFQSSFNAPADLTGDTPRSIELWVLNPAVNGVEETMVAWARRGGNPDGSNESISYGSTYGVGQWSGAYDMTWTDNAVTGASRSAPAANVWHYIAYTYDGSTANFYVDGNLQLSKAMSGLQTDPNFPINLAAQNVGDGTLTLFGSLDIASARISSGALTAADVAHNAAEGVPGQVPEPASLALFAGAAAALLIRRRRPTG